MFLQSFLLINGLLISIVDMLDFEVSANPILLMLLICALIQISVGTIDFLAMFLMLSVVFFMRRYLQRADMSILCICSLNMNLERLGIFFICMGIMSLISFFIGKILGQKCTPFTPHIITSHFISILY